MGAEPWSYFVPYQNDVAAALEDLKQQEFAAGRYKRPDPDDPPATIAEARAQADADGTRSILDMIGIGEGPHTVNAEVPHFGLVCPVAVEHLVALFGTEKPTRAMVETDFDYFAAIERGEGVSIVVYDGDEPSELFFAGYSYD